jgi:hypothetical protein
LSPRYVFIIVDDVTTSIGVGRQNGKNEKIVDVVPSTPYKYSMEQLEQQLHDAVTKALAAGWSMNALCESAGVSRSAVRDWHKGYSQKRSKGGLTLETAGKLAAWFGTELKRPKIPKVSK